MERLGRQGPAGDGRRHARTSTRRAFDPEGDLLSLVTDLQMTAIVGMIDPPRAESMDAVKAAQDANIRVRMVTGDDVVTGAAVANQLGIPGEAILGTEFAALSEDERLGAHRRHRCRRAGGSRAQGADGRDAAQEGRGRRDDR